MKKIVRSLLASVLAVAVIAALLWFGDVGKVIALVRHFHRIYVLWFLLLLLAHEVVRGMLWQFLVAALGIRAPLRTQLVAFAAGEAAKVVPTGAYLQNYVLQRATGADFGRSSAATTATILAEIAFAMAGLVMLGLGSWSTWLSPLIVGSVVVVVYLVWVYRALPHVMRLPDFVRRHAILARALDEVRQFRAGAAALSHPWIIGVTLLLTTIYVLLSGASLYIVVLAMDIGGVSFGQAVAVTCFGLAFYVIVGSLEAADVAALIGLGVSKSAAVSAVLVNRALGIGGTVVFAVIVMAVLHDEVRAVLWQQPGRKAEAAARTAAETTHTAEGSS